MDIDDARREPSPDLMESGREPEAAGAELPRLVEAFLEKLPAANAAALRAGYAGARERPVTLRANALKTTLQDVCGALDGAGIAYERVPWYGDALVLPGAAERDLWRLPLYQDGGIYLQSLSSMLPPLLLDPRPGADILDMCAAPGGKTSQIAALTGNRAHLTACEMKPSRADKLVHNLAKLGVACANVMRTDARRLDEFFSFDLILLDAPCTGSGTVRAGDGRALKRLTPELLRRTTRSQAALLDRALTVLKPGGVLIYSTCSILPEENDRQVSRALGRHRGCELVPLAPAPASGLPGAVAQAVARGEIPTMPTELAGTLTVVPTALFEGFYVAKIKKGAR